VSATTADLAAETGIAILRIAMTRWIEDPVERPWQLHVREAMDELRRLAADTSVSAGV
jgi:hypothetical protein